MNDGKPEDRLFFAISFVKVPVHDTFMTIHIVVYKYIKTQYNRILIDFHCINGEYSLLCVTQVPLQFLYNHRHLRNPIMI